MTNFEKYAQYIKNVDIYDFAVRNGKPEDCESCSCIDCIFQSDTCGRARMAWLMEEYKEPEIKIDWAKVPVDTPIYVSNTDSDSDWIPRYFSSYSPTRSQPIKTFMDGRTSFSAQLVNEEDRFSSWKYAKLACEEDIEKYSKQD